jgi:predicted RNA-binding protein YlqC (UPF0109 family)
VSADRPSDSIFEQPRFSDDDDIEDDDLDDDVEDDDDEADLGPGGSQSGGPGAGEPTGGAPLAVLEHVVRSVVEHPESIVITVSEGRSGTRLSLHVAPDDMGRVIGRRGRVAQAMRTLVRAAAARESSDATVDIVDE